MRDFAEPLPQASLNIEGKKRSNIFAWRGQFSPQLVESLLAEYCPPGSVVVDPFAGSGTVLCEAARRSLPAFGFEINPSAWCFSKLYELSAVSQETRREATLELQDQINREFPLALFTEDRELGEEEIQEKVIRMDESLSVRAKIICNALVVVLDIYKNRISSDFVQRQFGFLMSLIRKLPLADCPIKADLQDARALPLPNRSVDFAITSPPYINVFNYHQNYRRSVELLGWDLLRVARSEIGSNRANRANRFCTVVQYCIDMVGALRELARILCPGGRAILILGHQSKVLGTPFFNADIVARLACESGMFGLALRQQRVFKNRYGEPIREDVLSLRKESGGNPAMATTLGRSVAGDFLRSALQCVPEKNKALLSDAIDRIDRIDGTPTFDSLGKRLYMKRSFARPEITCTRGTSLTESRGSAVRFRP